MSNRQVIKQGFELVNARYDLNPFEMKLIMNAISEIKVEDKQFFIRKVSVKQLEKELKVQINYDQLKAQCVELFKKPIFIPKPTKKNDRSFLVASWFASIEYFEGTGELEYEISHKLTPYLLELKGRITKANLAYILPMKSFYSMRLYILLKEYQKIGSRTFEVAELQELLQVGESLKERYDNFKRKVLNVALKEINKSDLYIELSESKKERKKVIEITFKIQAANKSMTTEILQNYIGREISIKGEITKIMEAYAEDGNIYIFVMLKGDGTTAKKTVVEMDTKDKFFHALEMAERQGRLF